MIVTIDRNKETGKVSMYSTDKRFAELVHKERMEFSENNLFLHMGIITMFANNLLNEECLFEVEG